MTETQQFDMTNQKKELEKLIEKAQDGDIDAQVMLAEAQYQLGEMHDRERAGPVSGKRTENIALQSFADFSCSNIYIYI